jgi:hypothetical protein
MIAQQERMAVASERLVQSLMAAVSGYYTPLTPFRIFFYF